MDEDYYAQKMSCAQQKASAASLVGSVCAPKTPLTDGLRELRLQVEDVAQRVSNIRDMVFGQSPQCVSNDEIRREGGMSGDIADLNDAMRSILADLRTMESL